MKLENLFLPFPSFQMAASYLKRQFSIPHHLVPSFDDVAGNIDATSGDISIKSETIQLTNNDVSHSTTERIASKIEK